MKGAQPCRRQATTATNDARVTSPSTYGVARHPGASLAVDEEHVEQSRVGTHIDQHPRSRTLFRIFDRGCVAAVSPSDETEDRLVAGFTLRKTAERPLHLVERRGPVRKRRVDVGVDAAAEE